MIGCLAYLYIHVISVRNIDEVTEKIKGTINKEYEINQLVKEANVSDTIINKLRLADKNAERQEYLQAITLYKSCLEGFNASDDETRAKLLTCYFMNGDFENAIEHGDQLQSSPLFKNSPLKVYYAWALSYMDNEEKARETFESMNTRYSNFPQRIEFAKYLIDQGDTHESSELLSEMINEIKSMDRTEQRNKSGILKQVKALYKSVS